MACTFNGAGEDKAYFRVEADSSWIAYQRVVILLADTNGRLIDTLFDDSLASLDRLRSLPAGPYRGGNARITILGYRGDSLVFGETRVYDGATQHTVALEIPSGDSTGAPDSVIAHDPLPVATAHAPVLDSLPGDTTVSINDRVPLPARIRDSDGDLLGYAWSCDGGAGDTVHVIGYAASSAYVRSFPDSGDHACVLAAWDGAGHKTSARVRIRVEWDPPVADAGKDTTVVAGTAIHLHGKGYDPFDPIISREWQIGSAPFALVPQQDVSIPAPADTGLLVCVLRVTDSDHLTALDTLIVTVIPASAPAN